MKFILPILFALLLATAACASAPSTEAEKFVTMHARYADYKEREFPRIRDIAPESAKALDPDDILFVDVRTPEEQAVSMIPGAITAEAFRDDPVGHGAGRLVVAYCTISYRSGLLISDMSPELAREGIGMRNLVGGLLAWAFADGPLLDENGPTRRVHVYSEDWDYLPDDYEAVY